MHKYSYFQPIQLPIQLVHESSAEPRSVEVTGDVCECGEEGEGGEGGGGGEGEVLCPESPVPREKVENCPLNLEPDF